MVAHLEKQNKDAWDALYAQTDDPVWGFEPLGFVSDYLIHAELSSDVQVLDAAAGEGRNLVALLQHAAHVWACDASFHGLRKILQRYGRQVVCTCCDLGQLPYDEASFDLVLAADVIETLPTVEAALGELFRVMNSGGFLICNVPGPDDGIAGQMMKAIGNNQYLYNDLYYYRFWNAEEAEALLINAGFQIVQNHTALWQEPAHPNFRDGEHWHLSRIFVVRKPEI